MQKKGAWRLHACSRVQQGKSCAKGFLSCSAEHKTYACYWLCAAACACIGHGHIVYVGDMEEPILAAVADSGGGGGFKS